MDSKSIVIILLTIVLLVGTVGAVVVYSPSMKKAECYNEIQAKIKASNMRGEEQLTLNFGEMQKCKSLVG